MYAQFTEMVAVGEFCLELEKKILSFLKGQSHEKVGELRVWRGSLGPN
jgi:hypothetical protein